MWFESQGPTELGVLPRGIESIVIDDLSFTSDTAFIREHLVPTGLLRASAAVAVELMDYGVADEISVAEGVREAHPELAAEYGESTLRDLASSILNAELPRLSRHFQTLFDEFNGRYFAGKLPAYQVHVVFDLHRAAKEPVYGASVSSGLIRFEQRRIYLRYTNDLPMDETLIHEMAHAATTGEHDEEWLKEMVRLKATGAPVPDWELEGREL
jgi:hypothetical protein